jgi:hypothetical protein
MMPHESNLNYCDVYLTTLGLRHLSYQAQAVLDWVHARLGLNCFLAVEAFAGVIAAEEAAGGEVNTRRSRAISCRAVPNPNRFDSQRFRIAAGGGGRHAGGYWRVAVRAGGGPNRGQLPREAAGPDDVRRVVPRGQLQPSRGAREGSVEARRVTS